MIAAWIVYSLLAGGLVAAAACALSFAARFASLPTRWIWGVALVTTVALAAAAPFRGGSASMMDVALPVAVTTSTPAAPATQAHLSDRVAYALSAISHGIVTALARVASAARGTPAVWLVVGWVVVSGAALLLLVAVHARFGRLRRHWPLARLAGSDVRVAPDVGPAVIGVTRPEIVVPSWLLQRTEREQTMVIAHEAEHVRGRDPIVLGLAWLLVALVPWNVAAWWMLSRLRLAVELDCDARVLRRGVAPRAYGSLLIDLAGRCSGFPAGAPALADTPSHLERRLVAMRPDRPRFRLLRASGAAALAFVAILAACEAKMPTQDDVTSMDAASAERVAAKLQLEKATLDLGNVQYFVDDKPASAEEARAIAADHIATVNIMKTQAPDGHAVINIRTKSGDVDTVRYKTTADGAEAERLATEEHAKRNFMVVPDGDARGIKAPPPRQFSGLIYIDGVLSSPSALAALSKDQIVSVDVLKGEAAKAAYSNPAAANGVIKITTVNGAKK